MRVVVSTINGKVGIPAAMDVLRSGGSALDAVEAGVRVVERDVRDQSVGLGGLPNLLGEVRLDATLMDGRTLRAGAVGSVQGYVHVITLARRVMEETPHVFLVADGAERFAREIGFPAENPLTPEAQARWRGGLQQHYPGLHPSSVGREPDLRSMVRKLNEPMAGWSPKPPGGTVNFLARDVSGNLAAAVSTSGWPWGYPGRLGDSPVVGAGCYADNRYGAAASTGTGEVVLRTSASRSIVLYLKMGLTLPEAVQEALRDLRDLRDPYVRHIALIAIGRSGTPVGYSHRPVERLVYMTETSPSPVEADMIHVSMETD